MVRIDGNPTVRLGAMSNYYLDNAATSFPKPSRVREALTIALAEDWGNPGRSAHPWSLRAAEHVERTRHLVARLAGLSDPQRLVFANSGTDALHLALHSVLRPGDRVVTGSLEHNSVRRPLLELVDRWNLELVTVPFGADGRYDVDLVLDALRQPTRLVALMHASNVLGTMQPIAPIATWCQQHDTLCLVDAAQTAGMVPIEMETIGIDLLAASGHKGLLGPMGTGILAVGPRVVPIPVRAGGTGDSRLNDRHPRSLPQALEAGTPNVLGIVGLAAGVEEINAVGWSRIKQAESDLANRLYQGLQAIDGLLVLAGYDTRDRLPVASFTLDGWEPADLAIVLEQSFGLGVRVGHACAPAVHAFWNLSPGGAVRASAGWWTPQSTVDRLLQALAEIAESGQSQH